MREREIERGEKERERKGKMIYYINLKKKYINFTLFLTNLLHTQIRAIATTATNKTTATMETMTAKKTQNNKHDLQNNILLMKRIDTNHLVHHILL